MCLSLICLGKLLHINYYLCVFCVYRVEVVLFEDEISARVALRSLLQEAASKYISHAYPKCSATLTLFFILYYEFLFWHNMEFHTSVSVAEYPKPNGDTYCDGECDKCCLHICNFDAWSYFDTCSVYK